jgi:hypothetical protein
LTEGKLFLLSAERIPIAQINKIIIIIIIIKRNQQLNSLKKNCAGKRRPSPLMRLFDMYAARPSTELRTKVSSSGTERHS